MVLPTRVPFKAGQVEPSIISFRSKDAICPR